MKPAHIGVYAFILILLCGYYGFFEVYRPKQAKEQEQQAQKIFGFDPLKVEEICIERDETFVLKKTQDGWQLTSPVEEKADQNAVGSFLASLSDIRSRRSMGQMKDDSLFAKQMNITVMAAGQGYRLTIGSQNPTKDFRYATASGQDGVFMINAYEAGSIDRDLLRFRDKTIVGLKAEDIARVRIKNHAFSAELARNSDGVWQAAGKDLNISTSKIEAFIRDTCWLQANMIADNMQVGSQPDAYIELATADAMQSLTFWQLGKALFVKTTRRPQVVGIDPEFFAKIPEGLAVLEDRGLMRINTPQITKLSIGDLAFTHAGNLWAQADKPVQDGWKLDNLLEMLTALEFEEVLSGAPQGIKPENTLRIFIGEAQPHLTVCLYEGAIVESAGKTYRVNKDGYDMIKGSLKELAQKGVN